MLVDFFSEQLCLKNQAKTLFQLHKASKVFPVVAPAPLTQQPFWTKQLPPGQLGECQQISQDFKYVRGNSSFSHHFKNPSDRRMKWDNWTSGHIWVNLANRPRQPCSPLAAMKTNQKWKLPPEWWMTPGDTGLFWKHSEDASTVGRRVPCLLCGHGMLLAGKDKSPPPPTLRNVLLNTLLLNGCFEEKVQSPTLE